VFAIPALAGVFLERKLPIREVFSPILDKVDLSILDELQRDGRLTNAELAARVGLSAAP
jgi:hypothetical protein